MIGPGELVSAFVLDAVMGDPRRLPHPVRMMGRAIAALEPALRRHLKERPGGTVLAAAIAGVSFFLFFLIEYGLRLLPDGAAGLAASAVLVYLVSTTLALRELLKSVREVFASDTLEEAREKLGLIVGRDTGGLDEAGVHRAAVETLAENASDGVVAPLFYLALGGLPLAAAYKAANTLDSMVGYKNERYRDFGWASARLDDLLNYIPARLTGILMVLAAFVLSGFERETAVRSFGIMRRDGAKHTSPNSGIPEAAMAGALGLRLGGPSTYGGRLAEKPFIGDEVTRDIRAVSGRAAGITALASVLGLMLSASVLYLRVLP